MVGMDVVLNKIKTKVSSALPGNPLTREYDIEKLIGQAGPGMLWKLYAAKKRSTQQQSTVWLMEKKLLDTYPRSQRETLIDILKRGVGVLTRIKHPKIVSVLQPLEESRESLAFATEPLFSSLSSGLSKGAHISNSINTLKDFCLLEVEIKYGLAQIAEALNFLHSDCHRIHLNIIPESILINRLGIWKLGGFEFSQQLSESTPNTTISVPMWQSALMSSCQPVLCMSSPETVLHGEASPASDMFSLGLLICTLFNKGQPILNIGNDYSAYRRSIKDVSTVITNKLSDLPLNLKEYVQMMLSLDATVRPDAIQFLRTPYFEDASISVLRSIDDMYQLDNLARSQFYKSLPASIHTLPKRLCLFRIFPQITEDFSNPYMVPFILPAVLQIMEMVSQEEFVQYMLPRLLPALLLKEPVQIILIFIQNLRVLCSKFPTPEFRNYVLPMLQSALDTDNKAIQELCLKSLPSVSKIIDLTVLKNSILPRIQRLCLSTDYLSVRLLCLICIGRLLDNLDKWIVMDEVLPFLQQIKSRESTILMAIFGIYRLTFSHEKLGISREKLAVKVLPHLIPLSIESSLNLKQYNAFATLICDMCTQLEREQKAKLEQLHGVADENTVLQITTVDSTNWVANDSCANLMDQIMQLYLDESNHHLILQPATAEYPLNDQPVQSRISTAGTTAINTNPTTRLTLEQKRQMVAKQSQLEKLDSICSLIPKHANDSNQPKPKDLTSTLIESNLDAISDTVARPNATYTTPGRLGTGIPLHLIRPAQVNLVDSVHPSMWNMYINSNVSNPSNPMPIHLMRPQLTLTPPYSEMKQSINSEIKPLSKRDIDDLLS